jgi:hypothetical protein
MKTEFNSKDNVAAALLAITLFAIVGAMLTSNQAGANPAKAVGVQKLETIVVTAPRTQVFKLETIVVTASRSGAQS